MVYENQVRLRYFILGCMATIIGFSIRAEIIMNHPQYLWVATTISSIGALIIGWNITIRKENN